MCEFSAYVAFDKATNGQTDKKREMGKTFSSMSLFCIHQSKLIMKSMTTFSEERRSAVLSCRDRSKQIIYKKHTMCITGGRGAVVRESEFKSEDPGFDPLAGQDERQFFCPSEAALCADLLVPDPSSWVRQAFDLFCAHVKDPISVCRKRVVVTAGGMETRKLHLCEGGSFSCFNCDISQQ